MNIEYNIAVGLRYENTNPELKQRKVTTMYSRKPHTILTARIANAKVNKSTKALFVKEAELTSPAFVPTGLCYITVAGVTMPTNS